MKQLAAMLLMCGMAHAQYTIQGDVLGESLEQYQKNNNCTLRPHISGVEGTRACSTLDTHYAGAHINVKGASFYQGKLYNVGFATTTEACQEADVFSSLKQRYGAPSHQEGSRKVVWRKENQKIEFTQIFGQCLIDFSSDVAEKIEKLRRQAEKVENLRRRKEKEDDQ